MSEKSFISHFSQFFSSQALILLIGFITFPILTRVLSIGDYGILSVVTNTIAIAVAASKAGFSDGIIRLYYDFKTNEKNKSIFISTLFTSGNILSLFFATIFLILLPFLLNSLKIDSKYHSCFYLMVLYLYIRPLNIICLNLLRSNGKIFFLNALNLANKILSVCIGLFLLFFIFKNIQGYLIGTIIGEYIIGFILIFWIFSNFNINFKFTSLKISVQLIVFGFPLLLSEISYLLLSYADRYIILFFHGENALGLYSVGYNLATYLSGMITFSVSNAIIPLYVKTYTEKGKLGTEKFLENVLHFLLVLIIPICFGYYAISKDLFILLASEKYLSASGFSCIILYGSFFLGLNSILNAGLYIQKKTFTILGIIFSGVILNILLNLYLIPKYYVLGASITTLISCMFTTTLTIMLSYKHIFIKIRKNIVLHLILGLVMFFIVSLIDFELPLFNLIFKILSGFFVIFVGLFLLEKKLLKKAFSYLPFKTTLA